MAFFRCEECNKCYTHDDVIRGGQFTTCPNCGEESWTKVPYSEYKRYVENKFSNVRQYILEARRKDYFNQGSCGGKPKMDGSGKGMGNIKKKVKKRLINPQP